LRFADHYVIEPSFAFWDRTPYLAAGASPIAEDFRYASNSNDEWLDTEALKDYLSKP